MAKGESRFLTWSRPHPKLDLGVEGETLEMNVDLKRVREAAIQDGPSPAAKRRALSLSSPPAVDNGEDDRLEDWMKVVEVSCGVS